MLHDWERIINKINELLTVAYRDNDKTLFNRAGVLFLLLKSRDDLAMSQEVKSWRL